VRQPAPILVPVDFSEYSREALAWAGRLARDLGAPLLVLHVVHEPGHEPGYYQRAWEQAGLPERTDSMLQLDRAAAELMTEFLEQACRSHPVLGSADGLSTRLETGIPVPRILEVAAEVRAQHIVMGSYGRTGLAHLLIGSKASQIVHLSPVTVTIVKTPDAAQRD